MQTLKMFQTYLSGRLSELQRKQREAASDSTQETEFDVALAELQHIYTKVLPEMEEENARLRGRRR